MAILKEDSSLEEKLTAIYMKAFKTLNDFSPVEEPAMPEGLFAAWEEYKMARKEEKSAAWKVIAERFSGWVKERDRRNAQNLSNKHFLTEMKNHFEKLGMINYSEQIRLKLNEYDFMNEPVSQ